ncbi:hypothetical protein ACI3EY_16740 [Ornithinimicrobium sp. LYQ92]|uniref:hypothetical protein n=1 Tax=Serinicoccus sp. LYQ92 TaxID=3378798 RepID=UPI003852CB31
MSHIAKARELHNAYLTAKQPDIMFDRLELLLTALPDALDEAEVHERGRANAVRQLGEALDRAEPLATVWQDGYEAGHRDRSTADEIDADWDPTPNPHEGES